MKTKIITLFSLLMFVFSNMAYAANNRDDNINWKIENGILSITGTGKIADYTKQAPAPWADKNSDITALAIGEGITEIGNRSFSKLTSLKTISLPSTLTTIGERAFYGCSEIELLRLPNNVRVIKDGAFNGCTSVKRIYMPTELAEIGTSAFMNMPLLTAINIPEKVSYIGDWAFFGNSALDALYFEGKPVANLGKYVIGHTGEDYKIYYPYDYESEWTKANLFPLKNLYPYNPDKHVSVFVNNSEVIFDSQPTIVDGRTLVPVRAVFEAMGAVVDWDEETYTVILKKDDMVIKIPTGASIMHKNNYPISVDVPAQIVNNRVLVPVRVISDAFGAKVEWDNGNRHVNITL